MAVATKSTTTQAESDIQAIGCGSIADGEIIGSYRVVRFLGRGGMGEVYEVLHTLLGKRFALKVISKALSQDEKARNLFRREGREAGNLHHPNIVRVDDCGEVDGRMYLRMELIEGRPCRGDICITLTDYIIACQLRVPPDEAIPILHDILLGLNYAHSCRRVHRDIKPSNILMLPAAAKIGDFGLVMSGARPGGDMSQMSEVVVMGLGAQSMMNATQASGAAAAAGSPDYMAPELLSGSVEANYSTDVYSVGILLLEMLTGSRRVGAAKPSQLLRSYYKLDPWWDQLYERSTAYHEDRFANAGEMLEFFIEVSGLAKAKEAPKVDSQKAGVGHATTLVPANWGNELAATHAPPRTLASPPAAKPIPAPPTVAPKPVAPKPVAPKPVALPSPEGRRAAIDPVPAKARRGVPWVPLGAGGAAVVLGASLYLATRTTEKPLSGNAFRSPKPPAVERMVPTPPRDGTSVTPPKSPVPVEKVKSVSPPVGSSPVGSEKRAASGVAGGQAPTNAAKSRLDQQDYVRRQQEEVVSAALKEGKLDEAYKLVTDNKAQVDKALRESVIRAYLAAKKVAEVHDSRNVERLKEALEAWKLAKPNEMKKEIDPEIIKKAAEYVRQSTSEGDLQVKWRDTLRKAIGSDGSEDVPGIRSLLAEKRYEVDPLRALGERALQRAETTSGVLLGQAREAIKKGDLAGARLARESLNQHLVRTKQEPDLQLANEIASAQRGILERKVEKAVGELARYKAGETSPPNSTDLEVTGNSTYQSELKLALARQAEWKAANPPKRVEVPTPDLATPPQDLKPLAPVVPSPPIVPEPQAAPDSVDRKTYETIKSRINGLGNKGLPQQTKQDMMSFLQSYQKSHPEDAKEASKILENLRNR